MNGPTDRWPLMWLEGVSLSTSDVIQIVATLVAFGSMALAGTSYVISRKALRLSEAEYNEKRLPIHPYLIDAFTFSEGKAKCCAFALLYTNQSSVHQSLATIELEIEFIDEEGISGKAIATIDGAISPLGLSDSYKRLPVPLNLGPKEAVSGWVAFKVPTSSHRRFRVNAYRVKGRTVEGKEVSAVSYLLRHAIDEQDIDS